MALVSGSPISFIQNLQKPFYRYRPVVPTPEDLQLEPQVYEPQSGTGSGMGSGDGGGTVDVTASQITQLPLNGRNPQRRKRICKRDRLSTAARRQDDHRHFAGQRPA